MSPATWPRADKLRERLLWIDPTADAFGDAVVGDFASFPRAGDLLVVNDAATMPASLFARTPSGDPIELRLVAQEEDAFTCVVFGAGDWRTKTEHRPPPPAMGEGVQLTLAGGLTAQVTRVLEGRLVEVRFDRPGAALWGALYAAGRPIQYAYVDAPLPLYEVQTGYASRPWAAEMPSAGRPLTWSLLLALKARGVGLSRVTHAAGVSSTGDEALDGRLPWPERYAVPFDTAEAVGRTRRSGGRVIAIGTSVVRALEGAALDGGGELSTRDGVTNLVMGPGFAPRVVDGLFTGLHEATATHFALLQAFVARPLLERAYAHADRDGYFGHEFGDSCLILAGCSQPTRR